MIRRLASALLLLAVGAPLASCAYYNTFYLAQKYYERGAGSLPYPVEKADANASNEFRRSIDYSKKLLSQYPKSKWVDDAYLLWARGLLGRDDPLQTVNMLEGFNQRFPDSPLRNEARFYLGVGYRNARKYEPALAALDTFIARAPKSDLVPYAYLERARALASLERYDEAAQSASEIIERYPKSGLSFQAYTARAEARLQGGAYDGARADFKVLGSRSRTDEERLNYLLREADCLEAARDYDRELDLLQDALSYEIEPQRPDSGSVRTPQQFQQQSGIDRFGRILMRIGTAHLLAGRLDEAVTAYRRVVEDYPKTPLGGEAQYRIGYAYETLGDDFTAARSEYDKVKDQTAGSTFATQAVNRSQNLARIEQFRAAADDSSGQHSEAGFILAEQYLFQLEKPERALEEYRRIAREYEGTASAAKALAAEGWVLSRKLGRQAAADSLWWQVVHEYPATEGQLAARDFLELGGETVPESLIVLPAAPPPPPPEAELPPEPATQVRAVGDTVLGPGGGGIGPFGPPTPPDSLRRFMPGAAAAESLSRAVQGMSRMDSLKAGPFPAPPPALRDTSAAPGAPGGTKVDTTMQPDTTHAAPAAPADSARTAPADTTNRAPGSDGSSVGVREPDLWQGARAVFAAAGPIPAPAPHPWSFDLFGVRAQSAVPIPDPAVEAGRAAGDRTPASVPWMGACRRYRY